MDLEKVQAGPCLHTRHHNDMLHDGCFNADY